ncbi:MAG: type II 3-dehydroquinate dehydratase [Alphaproteobacteria bacterium]|nr:type II 3-dehydroquinate dehydratase [Alphaproteobacteria bacterium]
MNKLNNILVINGPNLNLLGKREPNIYGNKKLEDIENNLIKLGKNNLYDIDCVQSNYEGKLIEIIQNASRFHSGIIINAGGYSHTSIALMDALKFFNKPIIEVHMSNIYRRENFRHESYISKVANGCICGFGDLGYELAVYSIIKLLEEIN